MHGAAHQLTRFEHRICAWCAVLLLMAGSTLAAERPADAAVDGLRDPMEPAGFELAAPAPSAAPNLVPEYRLQAIKIDRRYRTALINNLLVTEGAALGDARVLKIRADEVVIAHQEQRLHLKLNPHAIKHPVPTTR